MKTPDQIFDDEMGELLVNEHPTIQVLVRAAFFAGMLMTYRIEGCLRSTHPKDIAESQMRKLVQQINEAVKNIAAQRAMQTD